MKYSPERAAEMSADARPEIPLALVKGHDTVDTTLSLFRDAYLYRAARCERAIVIGVRISVIAHQLQTTDARATPDPTPFLTLFSIDAVECLLRTAGGATVPLRTLRTRFVSTDAFLGFLLKLAVFQRTCNRGAVPLCLENQRCQSHLCLVAIVSCLGPCSALISAAISGLSDND